MPWGVLGPAAITWYIREYNDIDIKPIDVFYPVYYLCISQLLDPNLEITNIITSRTKCIHLYNEKLKYQIKTRGIDENCILGKMLKNLI